MNVKVNQNLPNVKTKDGVAIWYRDKWFNSEDSLEQAERKLTKLRELLTKEKKVNKDGPDLIVIENDDNPRLKEYEEMLSQMK